MSTDCRMGEACLCRAEIARSPELKGLPIICINSLDEKSREAAKKLYGPLMAKAAKEITDALTGEHGRPMPHGIRESGPA